VAPYDGSEESELIRNQDRVPKNSSENSGFKLMIGNPETTATCCINITIRKAYTIIRNAFPKSFIER
jgi:hypothetical protein